MQAVRPRHLRRDDEIRDTRDCNGVASVQSPARYRVHLHLDPADEGDDGARIVPVVVAGDCGRGDGKKRSLRSVVEGEEVLGNGVEPESVG